MNGDRRCFPSSVGFFKHFILQLRVTKFLFPAQQVAQVANAEDYERLVFVGPFL
jgi:hypothetical protein